MSSMNASPFADLNVALSRRVATALLSIDPDSFGALNITARADVVFLNGTVNDSAKRDEAVKVTEGTEGVAQVIDHLHIRPKPTPPNSALEVPLTTALPREPWWQRAVPPAAVALVVGVLISQSSSFWNGSSSRRNARLIEVKGAVFFEGEPAMGALLQFYPLDTADSSLERPMAEAAIDGGFQALLADGAEGVPAGRYAVTVRWHPYVIRGEDYLPGDNVVPKRYGDPRVTPFIVEVPASATSVQLPAFHLTKCRDAAKAER